jgi:uncharacterized protein YlxW (UPF0749 family)
VPTPQPDPGAPGGLGTEVTDPARPSSERSRGRRLAAQARARLRRPSAADIAAMGLFALAGAMFVAGAVRSGSGDLRVDSTGGLREAITTQAARNAALQESVDALALRVDEVRAGQDAGPLLDDVTAEIAALAPMAGLTEVRGPGVSVTLDDARPPDPLPEGMTGDDYIVHQQDVQGVVNALWRGNASGVTVMGQRLVSTSAVRCVGNTVILQGRVYSPPFVIAAVGDIRTLEQALRTDQTVGYFREWAAEVGMGYTQTTSPRLVLPPYTGPISPQYAQAVP